MKKLLIILPALLLLTACSSNVASLKVKSDIPGVYLEIPPMSLPNGMTSNDITISSLSSAEIDLEVEGEEFTGLELEPDGARFSEPLKLVLPLEDGTIKQFFHISGDDIEPVAGVEYVLDEDGMTASVPVEHFSRIVWINGDTGPYYFETSAEDVFVGDNTNASFAIKSSTRNYAFSLNDELYDLTVNEGSEELSGSLWDRNENLSPSNFLQRPPSSIFTGSFTTNANEFKCATKGPALIRFEQMISWTIEFAGRPEWPAWFMIKVDVPFECKERPAEPECGNNVIEDGELCDGTDLGGKTCLDFGFKTEDALRCNSECQFETDSCVIVHELGCNENTWDPDTGSYDNWICLDDCPEGQICATDTCSCETPESEEESVEEEEEQTEDEEVIEEEESTEEEVVEEEQVMIEAIEHSGEHIPLDQLHTFTGEEECDKEEHWHANEGSVTSVEGSTFNDPGGCGFGKTSDVPVVQVPAPAE